MKTSALVVFVLACGSPAPPPQVTIATPLPTPVKPVALPPAATPTMQAFIDAGCTNSKPDSIDCTGAKIHDIEICREPLYVADVKLDPHAAVVVCYASYEKKLPDPIRETGCMMRSYVHFFAATESGFVHISSKKQFTTMFAPVTTSEEAMAFATLLTGDVAYEKPFSPPPRAAITNGGQQVTHAIADGEGYKLRLFHAQMCGCHHPLTGVDYVVTREGEVTESKRTELWQDPSSMGLCVD